MDNINRHALLYVCPIATKLHPFIALPAISVLLPLSPPNIAWGARRAYTIPHVHETIKEPQLPKHKRGLDVT